ncbi:MAG TPA: trigger factor family protein, partial [Cytophagaceae bacterium]
MEIILEQTDLTNAVIKVSLKQEDYQGKVAEKLKDYSKKTTLKGFRPGKVPSSLIQKMYGKSILVDEINSMLSNSVKKYIQENKLNIVGDPLPESTSTDPIDWDNQKEFDFSYNIGIVPDFQYNLAGKPFDQLIIEVSDSDVEETIENLRNQYGKTS